MNSKQTPMQTLERRLRQQAAATTPEFDPHLHQRIMRAVAATHQAPASSMKISRWIKPLTALAVAAMLVLGVCIAPSLLKTQLMTNPHAGYSVELSAVNLLRHIPKLPPTMLALDRRMIDEQLSGVIQRASRVARNLMDASPIQFAVVRDQDSTTRQN